MTPRFLPQISAVIITLLPAVATAESWSQGIARLHERALSSENEVGEFYFQVKEKGQDTDDQWVGFVEGDSAGVNPDFQEAGRQVDKFAHRPLELVIGCVVHTHTKNAFKGYQRMSKAERASRNAQGLETLGKYGHLSVPPGLSDISVDLEIDRLLSEAGVKAKITGGLALVDSLGIWYWGLFRGERDRQEYLNRSGISKQALDAKRKKSEDINQARTPFMIAVSRANVAGETITSLPVYRDLQLGYAAKDIKLRFVPFSQLALEPPCPSFP